MLRESVGEMRLVVQRLDEGAWNVVESEEDEYEDSGDEEWAGEGWEEEAGWSDAEAADGDMDSERATRSAWGASWAPGLASSRGCDAPTKGYLMGQRSCWPIR